MMAIAQFYTDDQIPVPSVTADQMREVDRIAVEETGPVLFQMMENAGRNLALVALAHLGPDWRDRQVVVLAGTGGNGGGGICAARHLANRGAAVQLCLSAPERLQAVPTYQRHIYTATLGAEIKPEDLPSTAPDLIIDALLGYSLASAPRGVAAELINWANQSPAPLLSLDLPSGLNATTGETPGQFCHATTTLTLALPKTGLLPDKTGQLLLADIGIPLGTYQKLRLDYTPPFGDRFWVPLVREVSG